MMLDQSVLLIIDAVLMVLLAVAIWQARSAQRALKGIRDSQSELGDVVQALNRSIIDAQLGVDKLKAVAQETDQKLGSEIKKATKLVDELTLIAEAGNSLADRIEAGLVPRRDGAQAQGAAPEKPVEKVSKEQKELLKALKAAR